VSYRSLLDTYQADDRHENNPYAEWYFNSMRFPNGPTAKHHEETYGDAPYDDFLDAWTAKGFNAQKMVQLFAKAGAKYVVPVSKHHVRHDSGL
jgi:alpha-L-fucosidase